MIPRNLTDAERKAILIAYLLYCDVQTGNYDPNSQTISQIALRYGTTPARMNTILERAEAQGWLPKPHRTRKEDV